MDRRDFIKVAGGSIVLATSCAYGFRFLSGVGADWSVLEAEAGARRWGMLIDLTRCQPGCTDCLEACRRENNVAFYGDARYDVHWLRKVNVESVNESFSGEREVLLLCNHCDKPPCAQVCPVRATYKRDDGIVIVDHHRCIGCRYCMIACPYNARQFNFRDNEDWPNKDHPRRSHGVAEACNLCAHRLDEGQTPACVEACRQTGCDALKVGNLNDPEDEVARTIAHLATKRLREDLGTEPKVHYLGL